MSLHRDKRQSGVTLLEIMLVLVIISAILIMSIGYLQQRTNNMRIDRTAMQIQQIQNAAMAYYVTNGQWPTGITQLISSGFLTAVPVNPWGGGIYTIINDDKNLYVYTSITLSKAGVAGTTAKVIAGKLPFAYIGKTIVTPTNPPTPPPESTCPSTSCYVVSYVNMPSQTDNAGAVNFGGLYHHGACVPVPLCPVDSMGATMLPTVFIVPISVSGVNDAGNTPASTDVYPISSFTAYATGPDPAHPHNPPGCLGSTGTPPDCINDLNGPESLTYWRACLDLVTERGSMAGTGSAGDEWGQYVTLMALTRCASATEPAGSDFSIYSN